MPVVAVDSLGMLVMILVGVAPGTPDLGAAMTIVCLPPAPVACVSMPDLATLIMDDGMVLIIVVDGFAAAA